MTSSAFIPKTFKNTNHFHVDWDTHIGEQQSWLYEGMCHFNTCAQSFAGQIEGISALVSQAIGDDLDRLQTTLKRLEASRSFCQGMARQMEKGWHRVGERKNPFPHAGRVELEEQPESACSGANCELKQAGIDLAEIDAKKV